MALEQPTHSILSVNGTAGSKQAKVGSCVLDKAAVMSLEQDLDPIQRRNHCFGYKEYKVLVTQAVKAYFLATKKEWIQVNLPVQPAIPPIIRVLAAYFVFSGDSVPAAVAVVPAVEIGSVELAVAKVFCPAGGCVCGECIKSLLLVYTVS